MKIHVRTFAGMRLTGETGPRQDNLALALPNAPRRHRYGGQNNVRLQDIIERTMICTVGEDLHSVGFFGESGAGEQHSESR